MYTNRRRRRTEARPTVLPRSREMDSAAAAAGFGLATARVSPPNGNQSWTWVGSIHVLAGLGHAGLGWFFAS